MSREENPVEDKPPGTQPEHRRSGPHRAREDTASTREDDTPDSEDPIEVESEQDEQEGRQDNSDEHTTYGDSDDSNYLPPSEEEEILGDEDFIMPKEPLEQERFKHHLIATARSLKKKQQQLQADQDLLNDRWTNVLAAEEYGLERPTKSCPKRKLLPQFND